MKVLSLTAAALLVGATVYGQTADEAAAAKRKMAAEEKVSVMVRAPFEEAVKGAPYSGETVVETAQTLADGNHIGRKTTGRIYRDSDGRTRREEDRTDGTVGISIVDPVAGTSYSLDPVNRIAWKTSSAMAGALMNNVAELKQKLAVEQRAAQAGGQGGGAGEVSPSNPRVTVRPSTGDGGYTVSTNAGTVLMRGEAYKVADNTPLEHKTIDGLAVEGRKSTVTIPAGDVGNDQPIIVTSEEWRSPDLKVLVLTQHSDPRTGDTSYRLSNVIRAEPDRSLFIVPSDYTIKDTNIRRDTSSRR